MVLEMTVHTAWSPWAQLVIASLLMIVLGTPFFLSAFKGLHYRRVDMDTLIALGSGVAFASSVFQLLANSSGGLAFGTAVMAQITTTSEVILVSVPFSLKRAQR